MAKNSSGEVSRGPLPQDAARTIPVMNESGTLTALLSRRRKYASSRGPGEPGFHPIAGVETRPE
jgi:hypothetical protein